MQHAALIWLRDLVRFGSLLNLFVIFLSWLGLLNSQGLLFELPCYFRLQYLIAQLLFLPLLAIWLIVVLRGRSKGMTVHRLRVVELFLTFSTVSLNAALCLSLYNAPTATQSNGRPVLHCLQLNVLSNNKSYDKVANLVKKYNPDVIALQETNETWCLELESRLTNYPHRVLKPRSDNFGAAIFSKLPIKNGESVVYTQAGLPTIVAHIDFDGAPATVLSTHPLAPSSLQNYLYQNEQLANMADKRATWDKTVVLLGDLNTNNWADKFNRFLDKSELRDSRQGIGIQPSWPQPLPLLLIPLDHCLISPDLAVLKRRTCHPVGSDHLPVYVELQRR